MSLKVMKRLLERNNSKLVDIDLSIKFNEKFMNY